MNKNNQDIQKISNFVIFQTETGKVNIEVYFQNDSLWLTQKKMAELFETTPQNITLHLKNIFEEGELEEKSTCKDFLQVQNEGNREVKRNFKYYNLKAITSVGYRINSIRATEFRKWANVEQRQKYINDDYEIFMGVNKVPAKDNSGNYIFLKDEIGGDILASENNFPYKKGDLIYKTDLLDIADAFLDFGKKKLSEGDEMFSFLNN